MSAFSAGSIVSTLGLDVSPFAAGMLEANSIMSLFPQALSSFMVNPLLGVVEVLKDVATWSFRAFGEITDNADKLNDLSQATGVNVETLSALGQVADTCGANVDSVAEAFKFLGKNVSDAIGGDKSSQSAFAKLGIDADELRANVNDLPALMLKIGDAMKGMSGGDRTATAMGLFGRSGTDLIQMLAQGGPAIQEQMQMYRDFGSVVTASSAASADAWNDAMTNMGKAWTGAKTVIFDAIRTELLPVVSDTFEWVRENAPMIREIASSVAHGITQSIRMVTDALHVIKSILGPIIGMVRDLLNSLNELMSSRLGQMVSSAANWLIPGAAAMGMAMGGGNPPPSAGAQGVNVQSINISPPSMSADQISNVLSPQIAQSMERAYRLQESQMQAARARGAL